MNSLKGIGVTLLTEKKSLLARKKLVRKWNFWVSIPEVLECEIHIEKYRQLEFHFRTHSFKLVLMGRQFVSMTEGMSRSSTSQSRVWSAATW